MEIKYKTRTAKRVKDLGAFTIPGTADYLNHVGPRLCLTFSVPEVDEKFTLALTPSEALFLKETIERGLRDYFPPGPVFVSDLPVADQVAKAIAYGRTFAGKPLTGFDGRPTFTCHPPQGYKIAAVKHLRDLIGVGLAEAKTLVEEGGW